MKVCAILSMDSLDGFYAYDGLLVAPLKAQGWQTEFVSWRSVDIDWSRYDVVLIRSTWDYQDDVAAFLRCLATIEASGARLVNPLSLVEWNVSKHYLRDIEKQGVGIVPTLWFDSFQLAKIRSAYQWFDCDELIIKPTVSANADHTYRLTPEALVAQSEMLTEVFKQREYMVQPFLSAVVDEGEVSLFYFAGHYSHAIRKRPKQGDFRVQEEHGGHIEAIEPSEAMLTSARHALASLPDEALYARIDLINYQAELVVMEVELIEPSLYFNMDSASPQRFVDAFVETLGRGGL